MGLNITTTYPAWFIILCILAGILVSSILYYRNRKFELSYQLNWILSIIRAIFFTAIAFLLLNPLINTQKRFTEKPVILFLQDNSASIKIGNDSTFYQTAYIAEINDLTRDLEDQYEVKTYVFDDELYDGNNITFTGNITNFSAILKNIKNRYAYRNIGAMILASDGIYNRGSNPVYSADGLNFPVYTIALGDTNIQRDLILKKINFNRISYLDSEFPMEITIQAGKCSGMDTKLSITKDGKELYNKLITINSGNFLANEQVLLKATEKGLHRYTIKLTPLENEVSLANNQQDVFIDILEGKQKILLLSGAPHPDITAIKQAILTNKNYDVQEFNIDKFDQPVASYNLVILHGLPSLTNNISGILDQLREQQIPVLYILTKKTYYPLYNDQLAGVSIRGENLIYNEVLPNVNPDFSLFSLGDDTRNLLMNAPPIVSPYGAIVLQPAATPMLNQTIGSIETSEPLLVLNQTANFKSGVLLGEGIWRWRLKAWAMADSHQPFDQLINKLVQFLSLKVDKRFFRIIHENNFNENQNVEFEAQVYNEIYELINDPEVKIIITDQSGNDFSYVFNKTLNAYHLNAGRLPAGNYNYSASTQMGDKLLTDQGEFTVSPLNIELVNTVANHNLLYNLAHSRGGEMFYPNQMDALKDRILSRDDIKTISYKENRFSELLNIPWLLGILLILISMEWFVRKRAGAY